jgi:hypothetical protein
MSSIGIDITHVPSTIELDQRCWNCPGRDYDGCSICDGTGYTLTEDGRALLDFLKRHVKATARVEL